MIADKMGLEQPYDPSHYLDITDGKAALRDSIVGGNYDSSASSLAKLAIENYQSTGSTDGIDITDVNKFDRQQLENSITPSSTNGFRNPNTINFTPESIADSEKIIDKLRLGGFEGEANSLEASLQNLRQQELNKTGYERSGFAQSQEGVVNTAISQDGLSDESKAFARQAIHGHSQLPNIGAQHLDDLNKIYNRLDGAPEAQLKLVEAMSAQFKSDSTQPDTNSVIGSAKIDNSEAKQGPDAPRSNETLAATSSTGLSSADNAQPNVAEPTTTDAPRASETLMASNYTGQSNEDNTQPNVAEPTTTDAPRSNETLAATSSTGLSSADNTQPNVAAVSSADASGSSEPLVASNNAGQPSADNAQPNVAAASNKDGSDENTVVSTPQTQQESLAARRDAFENTQISDKTMQAAKDILTFGSFGTGGFSEEQKAELSELADNLQANNLNLDALEIRKAIEA